MFLESNHVRVEVLLLANHVTEGEKQGCYLVFYAITYFKIRVLVLFFFFLFFPRLFQ